MQDPFYPDSSFGMTYDAGGYNPMKARKQMDAYMRKYWSEQAKRQADSEALGIKSRMQDTSMAWKAGESARDRAMKGALGDINRAWEIERATRAQEEKNRNMWWELGGRVIGQAGGAYIGYKRDRRMKQIADLLGSEQAIPTLF